MILKKTSEFYLIRLDKGERVVASIETLCKKHAIICAHVNAIGAVHSAELGFWDTKHQKYLFKTFKKEMEVVNLLGNISLKENVPFAHLHIVLSGKDFCCIGGHLKEAIVSATLEIIIIPSSFKVCRLLEKKSGLHLLDL